MKKDSCESAIISQHSAEVESENMGTECRCDFLPAIKLSSKRIKVICLVDMLEQDT